MAAPRQILGVALALLLLALTPPARAASPLLVDGARPHRVVVMLPGTEWDDSLIDLPEMPRRLRGVLAVLEGESLKAMFESVAPARTPPSAPASASLFELRLVGRASTSQVFVREVDGETLVLDDGTAPGVRLDRAEFLASLGLAGLYRGDFTAPKSPTAEVVEFDAAPTRLYTLDARTVRSRLYRTGGGGGAAKVALSDAKFAARLPTDFDPRNPPGLVVWCSPMDPWAVPEELHAALDAQNFICIGALDAGNERPVFDRVQLALDAAATAITTWPIDTRRVYVVGMSGGAKVAMLLWAGWPEVFAGAVPIVGMASYKSEPAPGGGAYPPLFSKPGPATLRALKDHRVAPMTGPPDFNYDSVLKIARGLARDGLPVRVFEHADMAHKMPTPERFAEALRWVDEPFLAARRAEMAAADAALARAQDGDRTALIEVMRTGPWTPAAWKAWDRLNALTPADRAP